MEVTRNQGTGGDGDVIMLEERASKKGRREVAYAKYGLSFGSMEEGRSCDARSCGILAHGKWPSWALILQVGNLDLRWIIGLRPELHARLQSLFLRTHLVTTNIVDSVFEDYPVTVVLCKKRKPLAKCVMWTMTMLKYVVGTKRTQGAVTAGWHKHEESIKHVNVGGATDGAWAISIISKEDDKRGLYDFDSCPMGNIIGGLDQSNYGRACPPPNPRIAEPGVYSHLGYVCAMDGLYPCNAGPDDKFVVPCYRMKLGWCIRTLEVEEIWEIWDVSRGLTGMLDVNDRDELTRSGVPLKILGAVLRNVGTRLRKKLVSEGGCSNDKRKASSFRTEDLGSHTAKHVKILDPVKVKDVFTGALEAAKVNQHNLKAARADDSEVPIWIWNERVFEAWTGRLERKALDKALEVIRR